MSPFSQKYLGATFQAQSNRRNGSVLVSGSVTIGVVVVSSNKCIYHL